jgi:hypothetical protein
MKTNTIAGGVALLAALAALGFAVQQHRARETAAVWPATRGMVTEAALTDSRHQRFEDASDLQLRPSEPPFTLSVRYRYTVQGREYTSDRLGVGSSAPARDSAQRLLDNYGKGNAVDVHYNPADPSDAMVLE